MIIYLNVFFKKSLKNVSHEHAGSFIKSKFISQPLLLKNYTLLAGGQVDFCHAV